MACEKGQFPQLVHLLQASGSNRTRKKPITNRMHAAAQAAVIPPVKARMQRNFTLPHFPFLVPRFPFHNTEGRPSSPVAQNQNRQHHKVHQGCLLEIDRSHVHRTADWLMGRTSRIVHEHLKLLDLSLRRTKKLSSQADRFYEALRHYGCPHFSCVML